MKTTHPQQVAVLGLGYVGCVSAACLAHIGHRVTGVDTDRFKVETIREGRAPFYEPGLEELLDDAVRSGRLTATMDLAEALDGAAIAMICVGTPSDASGNLDMTYLRRAAESIAEVMEKRTAPLIVSIRSTVFPGINEEIHRDVFRGDPRVTMVSNPEFLREGAAVKDFLEPSLVVTGSPDAAAARQVAGLYGSLGAEPCVVSTRTAEMIKYACNAFHAVKVSFANEIGSLCEELDISGSEVMSTLCRDGKLNVSAAYLRPGFSFGGSCLPKDLRALMYRSRTAGLELPLLGHVLESNERHLRRLVERVMALPGKRIGIYGLAFKENTDDLRESPVVQLIEALSGKGRELRVYDPQIDLTKIYGSNQQYLFRVIPHIGNLMRPNLDDVTSWADEIVIAQRPGEAMSAALAACGKPVLNLAG